MDARHRQAWDEARRIFGSGEGQAEMDARHRQAWDGRGESPSEVERLLASGTAEVAYVGGPGSVTQEFGAFAWAGKPGPMVFSIGANVASDGRYRGWSGTSYTALLDFVVKLEYGSGNALQVVRMDLRTGSYQIPPCESVRASVEVRSTAVSVNSRVQMALVSGTWDGADIPTLTTGMTLGWVPANARAVELATPGTLAVDGQIVAVSDWTLVPAVQGPPESPVRVNGYDYAFTRAPGSTLGYDLLRFWLSL